MERIVVEKRKALLLNEEGKVLVFYKEDEDERPFLLYPTIKEENRERIPLLSDEELANYEYITTTTSEFIKYNLVNGHIVKTLNVDKRIYYALMHTLTDDEEYALMHISKYHKLYPDYCSLDELMNYFEYMYYRKSGLTNYVDEKMEPIIELQKRLGRKKERKINYVRY